MMMRMSTKDGGSDHTASLPQVSSRCSEILTSFIQHLLGGRKRYFNGVCFVEASVSTSPTPLAVFSGMVIGCSGCGVCE